MSFKKAQREKYKTAQRVMPMVEVGIELRRSELSWLLMEFEDLHPEMKEKVRAERLKIKNMSDKDILAIPDDSTAESLLNVPPVLRGTMYHRPYPLIVSTSIKTAKTVKTWAA